MGPPPKQEVFPPGYTENSQNVLFSVSRCEPAILTSSTNDCLCSPLWAGFELNNKCLVMVSLKEKPKGKEANRFRVTIGHLILRQTHVHVIYPAIEMRPHKRFTANSPMREFLCRGLNANFLLRCMTANTDRSLESIESGSLPSRSEWDIQPLHRLYVYICVVPWGRRFEAQKEILKQLGFPILSFAK